MNVLAMTWVLGGVAMAGKPEKAVIEAIEAWTVASDRQDADAVAALFRPDAVQTVTIGPKAMSLPTETYVQMIRDGKLGGGETSLDVHEVSVQGALATALTTRETAKMTMQTALVLEQVDGDWQISSARVMATPRE